MSQKGVEDEVHELRNQLAAAQLRVSQLERAVRKHASHRGQDLCWEHDLELWRLVLGEGIDYPHESVPPCDEFLQGCLTYWRSRQKCPRSSK